MGVIPDEYIDEVLQRVDIVELINNYVPLKKSGSNYKALCPFHSEKTPSFMVSSAKQIFHCFGCGVGGNAIGFLMKYEHMSFIEAVRTLAKRVGMKLPDVQTEKKKDYLWEVNKFAAEFYHSLLFSSEGKCAYEYLAGRGIKKEIMERFQLGYASKGNRLIKEARKKGFSVDMLQEAGLSTVSTTTPMDMFRNRVMFPICNAGGKVIGFSGRVLGDEMPKYLNTPETRLFHKGRILYGLHLTRTDIIRCGYAIICEGHIDLIQLYQNGVTNVVASQGTAFTEEQVRQLKRYTRDIIICFDGDEAGRKASFSGLNIFIEEGINVKVITLPEGYDPDEYVKENGAEGFRRYIRGAKDIVLAKLLRLCEQIGIDTPEGRVKVVSEVLQDLGMIKNTLKRHELMKEISVILKIPEDTLWVEFRRISRKGRKKERNQEVNLLQHIMKLKEKFHPEYVLVQILMSERDIPEHLLHMVDPSGIREGILREIAEKILLLRMSGRWTGVNSLLTYLENNKEINNIVTQIASESCTFNDLEKAFLDCIQRIKIFQKKEELQMLIETLKDGEKRDEVDLDLLNRINTLNLELKELGR